ncbi:putative AMIN domain-containing protein [Candidatus Magnetomoraceae bacterium gMMP-1]
MKRIIIVCFLTIFLYHYNVMAESLLRDIRTEALRTGGIKVIFTLDEVTDPKMFFYKGERPRVVCDFFNVKIRPGLRNDIKMDKNFIDKVRFGHHLKPRLKVRTVLDLVPDEKYVVKKLRPSNRYFSVIIRFKDASSVVEDVYSEFIEDELEVKRKIISKPKQKAESQVYLSKINKTPKDRIIPEKTLRYKPEPPILNVPNKWPEERLYGKIKIVAYMEVDNDGFTVIKGYFVNTSNEFYYQIILHFDIYDDREYKIANKIRSFFNIKAGEKCSFKNYISEKTGSHFKISNKVFW